MWSNSARQNHKESTPTDPRHPRHPGICWLALNGPESGENGLKALGQSNRGTTRFYGSADSRGTNDTTTNVPKRRVGTLKFRFEKITGSLGFASFLEGPSSEAKTIPN